MAEIIARKRNSETGIVETKRVLVDDSDYGWLSLWKWSLNKNGYIYRSVWSNGEHSTISMHRFIMDTPADLQVDHKNHDITDNRRSNLRNCTCAENSYNRHSRRGSFSRHRGVYWESGRGKWRAEIRRGRERVRIGRYGNEIAAAKAYNVKAKELFGEFACLNNIVESGQQYPLFEESA